MAPNAPPEDTRPLREKYPELYSDNHVDRRGATRRAPMKVLSLGFSRTGTKSTQRAYELLGYQTYHWDSIMENPSDADLWLEALDGKYSKTRPPYTKAEWDALLGHVSAVTDLPAVMFGPELIELYPDAKIVLVERDEDKWLASWNETVVKPSESPLLPLLSVLDPGGLGKMNAVFLDRIMCRAFNCHTPREMSKKARNVYRQHYDSIRRAAPQERLLEYRLGSGWTPLCEFLNVPVPQVSFPHVNGQVEAAERIRVMMTRRATRNLLLFLRIVVPVVVAAVAWYLYSLK